MVSHPENGSDSPIGSNRDRGRDKSSINQDHIHISHDPRNKRPQRTLT